MCEIPKNDLLKPKSNFDLLQLHARASLIYTSKERLSHDDICSYIRSVFYITRDIVQTVDAIKYSSLRRYHRGMASAGIAGMLPFEGVSDINEADVIWALISIDSSIDDDIGISAQNAFQTLYTYENLPYMHGMYKITPDMLATTRYFVDTRDKRFSRLQEVIY